MVAGAGGLTAVQKTLHDVAGASGSSDDRDKDKGRRDNDKHRYGKRLRKTLAMTMAATTKMTAATAMQ